MGNSISVRRRNASNKSRRNSAKNAEAMLPDLCSVVMRQPPI